MGKPSRPKQVKLIIGLLAKNKKLLNKIEEFFIKEFGSIDHRSRDISFDYTDYYKKEMGCHIKRRFISFKKLISPGYIADVKIITNSLERKFSNSKKGVVKRAINIDPGYISDSKLVLATTKDYFHRIYLKKGIYAEVTLAWQKGGFRPFEWTYPDYRTPEYAAILNNIRHSYMDERG
ncbi:MAG: DUF4416 family protein [Candidatus Omnitrophica bacterium]|nr:DUF4416 family protein [Candidatus Omnitrophota bacterium]MBU3912363.1 DUF4416 family protein [Candidatus Omnitrophota bacterium]